MAVFEALFPLGPGPECPIREAAVKARQPAPGSAFRYLKLVSQLSEGQGPVRHLWDRTEIVRGCIGPLWAPSPT